MLLFLYVFSIIYLCLYLLNKWYIKMHSILSFLKLRNIFAYKLFTVIIDK